MPDPASPEPWTESALAALDPHEHDFREFKGSAWLLDERGLIQSDFQVSLSKQVSAFANGAGGRIFLGIADDGSIDGGLPTHLKSGLRAWLEDLVPHSVEPTLRRCNVFEIGPDAPGSKIRPGHAVYVIDLPASPDAPHQASDYRYYLRIAGKSRPMGHVHVEDVLRRTRHPRVELSRVGPYGEAELLLEAQGPIAFVQLRTWVVNQGRNLAHHVGMELSLGRPFVGTEVSRRMREGGETLHSQSPGQVSFFRYLGVPLFPTQEVYVAAVWVGFHRNNLALARSGASLEWTLYADDAEPVRGARELRSFQVLQKAIAWIEAQDPTLPAG